MWRSAHLLLTAYSHCTSNFFFPIPIFFPISGRDTQWDRKEIWIGIGIRAVCQCLYVTIEAINLKNIGIGNKKSEGSENRPYAMLLSLDVKIDDDLFKTHYSIKPNY